MHTLTFLHRHNRPQVHIQIWAHADTHSNPWTTQKAISVAIFFAAVSCPMAVPAVPPYYTTPYYVEPVVPVARFLTQDRGHTSGTFGIGGGANQKCCCTSLPFHIRGWSKHGLALGDVDRLGPENREHVQLGITPPGESYPAAGSQLPPPKLL